jgi:hypothetical protein
MSVTKRISTGDYNLTTAAVAANVVVTTDTFKIFGNLFVQGNSSIINVANISTADPTITLDSNVVVPFQGNSGIEVNRGIGYAKPALFWNETVLAWQTVTNIADITTYANISGAGTGGSGTVTTGVATQLAYYIASNSTVFSTGANLTWNGANLLNITGNVETSGIRLDNVNVTPPPAIATIINVIGNTAGNSSGGTGIYFNNNTESGELISKNKAIAYSIIFG